MAGLIGYCDTEGEVALVAATAKTVLQIAAPTNQRVKVKEWGVFFDGTSASAEPVVVRVLKQTTAGTMSSCTETKRTPGSETLQVVGQRNASAEPTASDIVDRIEVHPQAGYEKQFGPGDEIILAGGERLGIECTAPAGVNVSAKFAWEE